MAVKKKIVIVNNLLGFYGAENVLLNMAKYMDQAKYDITVLTLKKGKRERLPFGIKYHYIFANGCSVFAKIRNKLLLSIGFQTLAKIFCQGYDIAIAFKMGECAKLVSFCDAPKKYCWIHSNVADSLEPYSYSFESVEQECACLNIFSGFIAVSRKCVESFREKYAVSRDITVIYNPVDQKKIMNLAAEPLPEEDRIMVAGGIPTIGSVARIEPIKGIDRLLNISKRLEKEGILHKLLIIGDGADFAKCVARINREHINCATMVGFRENPYNLMRRFSVLVCSSYSESFSLVVNEALCLEIPVISTRCGGPEEILENGRYGVLTENDEESLYSAVKEYILTRTMLTERYDPSESIKTFVDNVDKLLGETS